MKSDFEYRFDIWLKIYQSKISCNAIFWIFYPCVSQEKIYSFMQGDLHKLSLEQVQNIDNMMFKEHHISNLFWEALLVTIPKYEYLKDSPEYEVFILSNGTIYEDYSLQRIIDGNYRWCII